MNKLVRPCHQCSTQWVDTAATSQCLHNKMEAMQVETSAVPSIWSPISSHLPFYPSAAGWRRPQGVPTLTGLMLFNMTWNGLVWIPMKWRRWPRTAGIGFQLWILLAWCLSMRTDWLISILQNNERFIPRIYKIGFLCEIQTCEEAAW